MSVRDFVRYLFARPASSEYEIVDSVEAAEGWRESILAQRQHEAYKPLLADLRRGNPRADLRAAADAIAFTRIAHPTLLEIGCGTGYYSEVLETLAGSVRYFGLDYSPAMVDAARRIYPHAHFLLGDATTLPLHESSVDIALSGNSLMHIPNYRAAVFEAARTARRWCVFHSVPVLETRATTRMSKKAYGVRVFEVTFNRHELEDLFADAGLAIRDTKETTTYDLSAVLGERPRVLTYVCEKRG